MEDTYTIPCNFIDPSINCVFSDIYGTNRMFKTYCLV